MSLKRKMISLAMKNRMRTMRAPTRKRYKQRKKRSLGKRME